MRLGRLGWLPRGRPTPACRQPHWLGDATNSTQSYFASSKLSSSELRSSQSAAALRLNCVNSTPGRAFVSSAARLLLTPQACTLPQPALHALTQCQSIAWHTTVLLTRCEHTQHAQQRLHHPSKRLLTSGCTGPAVTLSQPAQRPGAAAHIRQPAQGTFVPSAARQAALSRACTPTLPVPAFPSSSSAGPLVLC